MRVHELAKELGLPSKEAVDRLKELGADVKSHMSAVDEEGAELLRASLDGSAAAPSVDTPVTTPVTKPEPVAAADTSADPEPVAEEPVATADDEPSASPASDGKVITIRGSVIVKELAELLGLRPNQLVAELMQRGVFASISERLDLKVAQAIASAHGVTLEHEKKSAEHKPVSKAWAEETEVDDTPEDLVHRPPVVTFLGHVDHGKTSLLDRIRDTMVAKGEAGGITQHIGAYSVEVKGKSITFLDTPGHAAFTAMRARGANLTDIAVIIIAADDGIMPQTKEAIQHAQAANASVMIAINKIDLPGANPDNVRQQLQAAELTPEEWGGETICCEVSAETGDGIEHLLEMILLQAEVLELRANPKRRARGYVVEARLESGMGPTSNVLVKQGTLKLGDPVLAGPFWGRAKALISDCGDKVKDAGPSVAVRCLGLDGVPEAGTEFMVCSSDKIAKTMAGEAQLRLKDEQLAAPPKVSLENLYEQLDASDRLELNIILKADTQGSLEAIKHSLDGIQSDKISLKIVGFGVGNITVNDILLGSASNAVVIGFGVSKESGVNGAVKREGVEVRLYSVIYELIEELRESMTGMLSPELRETVTGHAHVQEVFAISKLGKIAGCLCIDGKITPKSRARVLRADEVLFEGTISSLRRFQNDASEVRDSQECGIRLLNFAEFAADDILEFYNVTKVAQTL